MCTKRVHDSKIDVLCTKTWKRLDSTSCMYVTWVRLLNSCRHKFGQKVKNGSWMFLGHNKQAMGV